MFESNWQDLVFMAGNVLFSVSLLPSIFSKDKPSIWTSLPTALMLTAFCVALFTLDLVKGAAAQAFTALAWWILFLQKIKK
jgi:hypothetical protein